MADIPRDPAWDNTLALLREGYRFISNRCERHGSDLFLTRLMLKKVVCLRGAEASKMFYAEGRFTRRRALPSTTVALLQDKGSVQLLDGAAHRRRKKLFMDLTGPVQAAQLAAEFERRWLAALPDWQAKGRIALLDEAAMMITRSVCAWAGVPLSGEEAERRCREISAMIENSARFGLRHWRARVLRRRAERWAQSMIESIRNGGMPSDQDSAAKAIAGFREEGKLLPPEVAAVELLNILRPTVAVSRFITFAAMALHRQPQLAERVKAADEAHLLAFVQEVRRTTPLLPMMGGRVLESFEWRGHRFEKDDWVLLDLYGTNVDERLWPEPEAFRPERFEDWKPDPYSLIPQGGGDANRGHRCPGEPITIALTISAVRLLTRRMRYSMPEQDLGIDPARIPATPASRFLITDVQPVPEPV